MLGLMGLDAELIYLFRHQVLRDGLYQLLLPSERANLHALALEAYGYDGNNLHLVRELAYHAGAALSGGLDGAREQLVRSAQLGYLRRWAELATEAWLTEESIDAWRAVAAHAESSPLEAARAHVAAYVGLDVAGRGREGVAELAASEQILSGLPEHGEAGVLAVKVRTFRSRVLIAGGEPGAGLKVGESSVALAEQLGDAIALADALDNLSWVHNRLARLPEALALQERAIAIARQAGASTRLIAMLNTYASILRENGRNHDAVGVTQEALSAARASGSPRHLISALNTTGISCRATGLLTEAEAMYREALDIARRYGLHRGHAIVLGNYANLLSSRHEYDGIEEMYRRVIALYRETGDMHAEASAWHNLSEAWLGMGLLAAAARGYEQAIQRASRTQHFLLEARAWCSLGCCKALLGSARDGIEPVRRGLACLHGRDQGKFMVEFGILSELIVQLAQPDVADPRAIAAAALERMQRTVTDSGQQADMFAAAAIGQVRKVVEEYEAAASSGGAPKVVRGRLLESLTVWQRAALASSMKTSGEQLPADLQAALTAGLEDSPTPDWANNHRAEF
jgi:tetratricopeptide (TPR) repeat protein